MRAYHARICSSVIEQGPPTSAIVSGSFQRVWINDNSSTMGARSRTLNPESGSSGDKRRIIFAYVLNSTVVNYTISYLFQLMLVLCR